LTAALDWLKAEGVDRIFCAGDVANFGPQPNECIALLAERHVATVQGNCDRDLLLPPPADDPADLRESQLQAINDWGRQRLSAASRQWLANLPALLSPAPGLLVVHGSLDDPDEIVEPGAFPRFPPGVTAVAAGHLHRPFVFHTSQGVWVNAGSAGRPCDGDPRAAAAVLTGEADAWRACVHRIPFDLDAACQAILRAKMPYAHRPVETQLAASWW
jgi:predicted phosphodiesterase